MGPPQALKRQGRSTALHGTSLGAKAPRAVDTGDSHGNSRQRISDHGRGIGPRRRHGADARAGRRHGRARRPERRGRHRARDRAGRQLRALRRVERGRRAGSRQRGDTCRHAAWPRELRGHRAGREDRRQGRRASARRVREDDQRESRRHVQHDPARRRRDGRHRADRGRRAWRDREYRVGCRIRRTDRPGRVRGIEEPASRA